MTDFTRRSGYLLATCALGLGLGMSSPAEGQAEFGSNEDVGFAQALWQGLIDDRLAGGDAIESRAYEGTQPHGAMLQTLKARISVGDEEGQVIVKRNFADVDHSQIWSNPDEHLASITVMFQRTGEYDPDNDNWFWAKYLPEGSLDQTGEGAAIAGRVGSCIGCHQDASGDDMIFLNDE